MTNTTAIILNTKLNPAFSDGELVILTEDCQNYSRIASEFNPIDPYF